MENRLKVILITLISILTFLSSLGTSIAFAQTNSQINYEIVNPDQNFKYGLKRLEEKILLFVYSFSPSTKADYYKHLVDIRLAELKYIVDKKDQNNFETATKRYFTTVGDYVNYLNSKNLGSKKRLASQNLNNQIPTLSALRDTFDPTSAQWRFIEDDINYIKHYSQLL